MPCAPGLGTNFLRCVCAAQAYADYPLPIGHGQTISQPHNVAFITEAIRPKPEDKILEIGAGSGYQAAVLAATGAEVYTVEIVEPLAEALDQAYFTSILRTTLAAAL
jgi:protein-L-isoaspartate(D-aspartate) O-methyltransferase